MPYCIYGKVVSMYVCVIVVMQSLLYVMCTVFVSFNAAKLPQQTPQAPLSQTVPSSAPADRQHGKEEVCGAQNVQYIPLYLPTKCTTLDYPYYVVLWVVVCARPHGFSSLPYSLTSMQYWSAHQHGYRCTLISLLCCVCKHVHFVSCSL